MNVDGFARLLTDYCLEVASGQQVQISSSTLAAPLLLALQREVLERGAWPLLDVALPGQSEGFWRGDTIYSLVRRHADTYWQDRPLSAEVEAIEHALASDELMNELISHSAIMELDEFFALGPVA